MPEDDRDIRGQSAQMREARRAQRHKLKRCAEKIMNLSRKVDKSFIRLKRAWNRFLKLESQLRRAVRVQRAAEQALEELAD